MKNITKITTIGLPSAIELGLAWVGDRIIRNERKLAVKEQEKNYNLNSMPKLLRVNNFG